MKNVRGFAVGLAALALIVVLMTPSGAYANVASNQATVGDFLSAYAKALSIELPASAGADALVASLRAAGVKLDADINPAKVLMQADVVRIGKANGLRLTSRNPGTAFTATEIVQFFTSYGVSLAQAADPNLDSRVAASDNPPGDPAGHANTNKGKKKGRPFQSPSEPN